MGNRPIFVTGHKSPDTDSICSAIGYAHYKTEMGAHAVAICAGTPNKETAFALSYFGVEAPPVVKDFYVKVREVLEMIPAVDRDATLSDIATWKQSYDLNRIPVVDGNTFVGLIHPPVLANAALEALSGGKDVRAKDIVSTCEHHVVSPQTPLHSLGGKHCGYMAVVEEGTYLGMVNARAEFPKDKQEVILVDHNESVQIIDGIEEAEIIENIDHHRIGGLTTEKPIFIYYEPVGCTGTIVANFYRKEGVTLPKHIAGLLLSAIISDTVLFRSPTCTDKDVETAKYLAEVAEVELEAYGMEMLKAGADVSGLTHAEIVRTDMKEFGADGQIITIAQISLMDTTDVLAERAELVAALEGLRQEGNYTASYLMVTNILEESTMLLYSGDVDAVVARAFGQEPTEHGVYLEKTMSRKKQIVPPILGAMK